MLIILGNGASLSCVLSLYARAYPWRPDSPGQAQATYKYKESGFEMELGCRNQTFG